MPPLWNPRHLSFRLLVAAGLLLAASLAQATRYEIQNISYDTAREFYRDFNPAFARFYRTKTGDEVIVRQSHGSSGIQARAVIGGLYADVVTLALASDIDIIAEKTTLIPKDWRSHLKHNSAPYTSTIVFVVRKGNPKNIRDWDDLTRDDVKVVTPNPKTSGGARWNYLAAWAYGLEKFGSEKKAREFVKQIFKNVPVLDAGPRDSTYTFTIRGVGDVFLSWEKEAFLIIEDLGKDKFEIVAPSISILAEPVVAVVDEVVKKKGTEKVARAYLEYLYSKEGQRIAAKHYYRPVDPEIAHEFANRFTKVKLISVDKVFGGWQKAQPLHFGDGGEFDKIQTELRQHR